MDVRELEGATLRHLDMRCDEGGWSVSATVDAPDRSVVCVFEDVQWVQLAGTWRQGMLIREFVRKPVPDVLYETLSLVTHPYMYVLSVRGGSALTLVALDVLVSPAPADDPVPDG